MLEEPELNQILNKLWQEVQAKVALVFHSCNTLRRLVIGHYTGYMHNCNASLNEDEGGHTKKQHV